MLFLATFERCTASYTTLLPRSVPPVVVTITKSAHPSHSRKCSNQPILGLLKSKITDDDTDESYVIDIELAPEPDIDFSGTAEGNSFLFNDRDGTVSDLDADALTLWQQMRTILPSIITGAWDANIKYTDENPWGAIYNMLFVRIPVLVALAVYLKNLIVDHHGFVVNFGYNVNEDMVVSPLLVIGVAYLMLGPLLVQTSGDEDEDD